MKSAYLKIFLTLFIASLAVIIFSSFFEKGNLVYHRHKYKRIHEIFADSTSYDALYIGSSRVHCGINPRVVDSIAGIKSYNAAVEGGTMFEFKMTLDGYLVHHPAPRILILGIDAKSFDIKRKIFYTPQYFRVLDNPVVYNSLDFKYSYEPLLLKKYPAYRVLYYNDYIKIKAMMGLAGRNEMQIVHAFEYNGFLSNGEACMDTAHYEHLPSLKFLFQQNAITCLQNIIDTCKKKNISLWLTYGPEYRFKYQHSVTNFALFNQLLDSISATDKLLLFHDDILSLCNDAFNFANPTHLNLQGATLYSVDIGNRIKASNIYSNKTGMSFY